jgi:signal peptidase II
MLAAVCSLLIDQLSKHVVVRRISETEVAWRHSILSIRRVTVVSRTPASARRPYALLGVWALAVLGTVLYATAGPARGMLAQLGLGCAIGGATSNLLDRLWRGSIVDFISVGFWPTFNLADAAIAGGVLLALCAAG